MPHCITERQKKQPEYIAAMNKYNMSSDDLELILYKWQNLEDNQEAMSKGELPFVPDSFIEENYFPKTQQVQDEAFVKLWEKEYKNPKIFDTLQEAQQEADRVSKLFGNGSVVVRNTKDNKYKVVVAEQLLTDKQTKTLNQFYDKRDISRITDSSIVLSPHDSEDFNKQVSSGYYPQMFTIKTRDGLMTLTKINNRKRSRQYKVVSSDGKVIAEKLKLYTDEQYYKYQKSIEDSYDKFNKYNEGRSLTFKTFLEMPSKGLFKKMAKEWLKEAGRVDDLFIDIKLIDEFVNKFSDDFWKHVITYITSPQTKFIGTYANVLGVTYNNSNSLINKGWIFNYTIPKQGLIDELEKAFNIKIDQQELFGKKINRSLKYNDLEDIVRQYLARKLYISEKDHIKAYAKYHNLSITEVEATVEKLKENIKTDGKLEDSKQLREIIEFGAIDAVIAEIKSKYDNDLIEYMEKRGLKIPKQAASIVFNRQYLSGSDTKINRLATIFHEPFHAIEFLAQDSEELQKIYSAYDQLINTSFGKTLIEKIKDFNTVYDENTLKSEVLANLFSVLMMPEEMKQRFLQQSEDNQILGVFLQKEINAILNSDHTIKYLQSKTVAEEKTILKTVTKEERETLPILKQIWNNFINLLQKYFNFVNESWKFAEKTNVIKETFAETQTTTHTIYEEIIKQDEQFEAFEEALNILNQYLLDVTNVNISNQGYNEFEKSSYSVSQSQSQQQFVPQNTYNGVTENNSSNNATTSKIIAYTPKGKERQTYTIVGNKIYNKDGVEVFKEDGVDRNKIFANLAVQEGRAVVVTHNERQYVVNNRNQIISVTTGELMKWNENDEDRNDILNKAQTLFQQQNEVQQPTQEKDNETTNPNIVVNSPLKQATFEAQVEKLNSEDKAYFENQKTEYEAQEKVLGFDNEFTPTEIDELCRDVAFNLSYILQQDASVLKQAFDLSESEDDIRNMSSLQLAKKIGLKNLFFYCKETMFETKDDWSFEMIDQADILKQDDVFNVLLLKANPTFISIEGWGFKFNNDSSVEVNENVDLSESDNFNESQNTADVAEVKGNTQEAWQIDSNTLNVISTMSQRVKQQLAQCFKLDKNGDYILSKWGVPQRLSVTEATAQILTWTRGAINLSHMIKLLKKQVDNNMWLQPLLDRLTDNSGNESQFQSQFFTSFAKHHQNYSVTTLEDGRFAVKPLNDNTALSDAKKTISSLYKIGEHPLFTSNGEINATNYKQLVEINDLLTHTLYNDENKQIIANNLTKAAILLGFTTTEEDVLEILDASTYKQMVANSLQYIVSTIANQRNKATWEPFSSNPKKNGIINNIGKFITPLTAKLDAITIHSFFNKGKMYQSDVQPSYLSDLMDKFNLSDEIDPSNPTKDTPFTEFIWNEYAKYKQFRDSSKDTGNRNKDILIGWKSPLLKALVTNPTARRLFSHKVSLSFNNKSYMDSDTDSQAMLSNEYLLSIISEYFAATEKGELLVPAWFRIPMMANKASAEYIQMLSYRGADYKDNIVNDLKTFFDYELSRMQTIMLRNKQKGDFDYIENLEKNGKKFCFLPSLNIHLDNDTRLGVLIKNKLNKGLSQEEEVELNSLALKAIRDDLEEKAQNTLQNMEQDGFLEVAASRINGLNQDNVRDRIENFIWNDFLASKNILQFTIGDIAQYKNTVELQKRLKELQAPGIKPNVQAVDFDNNPVTDGFNRTIYLTDFEGEIVKSNIIENVRTVFDKKLATIEDKASREYQIAKETYDNIIKQFEKDINVADGQAYVSISAMRKKMIMFGKWSKADEDFYQKFKSGNWDHTDFQRHFNPLKPFVYSQIGHSSGVEDAPISEFKMGVQYKNSEYLLMYANAIALQSDRPNILKALADIMEDSAEKNPTKGIDNIQFVSAVKTGITGVVDIISLLNEPNGEKAAKEYVESLIYNEDGSYNKEAIQEVPFEDYKIQQEIPDHFMDHFQAHGSQIRMIIPSDLDVNSVFTYTDGISQVEKNGEEFRKEYEKNIAENINESIDEVISALNLNGTPLEKNIALSRILKREIISSARYGMDLYMACSLNENGEFRIPLTDPIQSKRIEQLLNSIIKNRINKQEIAGGPVVQVSNFGVSRQLNIVFKSKDGSLLKTLKEYTNEGHTEQEWVEYVKENQSGISHYEVFVSATYKKLYQDFMDEKGNLDVKAIEKLNPDLLKMIGYRIPTEDKYSTFPCKIVGFLPSEAGEAIMLPYEITLITGSDFDIDKMYLMIKEINIKRKKNVRDLMYNSLVESRREYLESKGKKITHEEKQKINEEVDMFLSNPSKMTQVEGLSKSLGEWYRNNAFEATVPLSGRSYRNNKIVDMTWSVLTHPDIASQVLKPGGFEEQKNVGYSAEALRLGYTLEEVQSKSTSELKDMCAGNKDLTYIDTQIEFYQQNSAAASLLPIFATQKIAHAALAGNKYSVDIAEVCSADKPFYLCGQRFGDLMYIDEQKNILGQYIGNDLGSCVAASADAVKDPVFNYMNINNNTVNVLSAMIRMGIPFKTAAMVLSSKIVGDCLSTFGINAISLKTSDRKSFIKIVSDKLDELRKSAVGTKESTKLDYEDLTLEELYDAVTHNKANVDYKILNTVLRFNKIAKVLKTPTAIAKLNSISNAVGPLVIDNLVANNNLLQPMGGLYNRNGEELTIDDIFLDHPILHGFYQAYNIANNLFSTISVSGSTGFTDLLRKVPYSEVLYHNRKLLNQFSDFYKSYLALIGGVVNDSELNYYINTFPAEFNKMIRKDSAYKDNFLIQSIRYTTLSSGNVVLNIDIDKETESKLSSAWLDLYKQDEDLAIDLFKYSFFRGGIGFSPKTIMKLLPIQLKEKIENYVQTFRRLPSYIAYESNIADQFVQNYYKDNKLVPVVDKEKIHSNERYIALEPDSNRKFSADTCVKVKNEKGWVLYKIVDLNIDSYTKELINYVIEEMPILGNNNEYLEIALHDITKPLSEFKSQESIEPASDVKNNQETEENDDYVNASRTQITDTNLSLALDMFSELNTANQEKIYSLRKIKENDSEKFEEIKPKMIEWFKNKAQERGITINEIEAEQMLNLFC